MTKKNQMLYLEIHGIKDGQKTFGCGTRYDWYVIQKTKAIEKTRVIDEEKIYCVLDMEEFRWLPNSNIQKIQKILAKAGEERCPIIYSRNNYASDNKKHISKIQNEIYKYPIIHTIPLSGVRYIYSSKNDKGHFGIPKVIFGQTNSKTPIVDKNGDYGMTEHSMAIEVKNIEEIDDIYNAIKSKSFQNILISCTWSNFMIDWRLFQEFKEDFWKEFV
jgi:hypothetical protein